MTKRLKIVLIILSIVLVAVMATGVGLTVAIWDSQGSGESEYGPVLASTDWNSWAKYFDNNGSEIIGYTGTNLQDVILPNEIDGFEITTVKSSAFASTTTQDLPVTVYISPSISKIEASTFINMTSLQKVVFAAGSNVTIGDFCFAGCSSLKEIVIEGNRTVNFASTAFIGCTSLETITGYTSEQIDALNI